MDDRRTVDIQRLQQLAAELDGKGERLAAGRGR
jgi:hypothetical protein